MFSQFLLYVRLWKFYFCLRKLTVHDNYNIFIKKKKLLTVSGLVTVRNQNTTFPPRRSKTSELLHNLSVGFCSVNARSLIGNWDIVTDPLLLVVISLRFGLNCIKTRYKGRNIRQIFLFVKHRSDTTALMKWRGRKEHKIINWFSIL